MKVNPMLSLLLVLGLLLAACAPATQLGPGATQQPGATGEPVEKTIIVGPQLVDCEGVASQKCLQVKESPGEAFKPFPGQIEGFQFKEGQQYTLVVKEQPVENPPADAPNVTWSLLRIESQAPGNVSSETQVPPATPPPAAGGEIEGPRWLLARYADASGQLASVIDGTQITAEFKAGQLGGTSGCNSYFASYQLNGSEITIGQAGMTAMACPDPEGVMDQESAYVAALQKAASYQVTAGQLEIRDAAGQVILVYASEQPVSLRGVTWILETYNVGTDAMTSAIAGTQITAIFGEDGNLGGSAGCNSYGAGYTVDASSIKIEQPISTMMFCNDPQGVMDQETAYLTALPAAASYEISGDRLTLKDASGTTLVVYRRSGQKTLVDTAWYLSQYYVGKDAVTTPLAGTILSATFSPDGKVSGSAGCNSFSATYEVEGGSLKIGPVVTTKMACAEPQGVMEQEAAFLAFLDATTAYEIQGDRLILRDDKGADLAEFIGSDLVGVDWKWQAFIAGDGSATSPSDPAQYTVKFLPDGTLAIGADCNQAGGVYHVEGDRLSIELGASTLVMCPAGSLSQEFLNLLGGASSFLAQEDALVIRVQSDSGTMQFTR